MSSTQEGSSAATSKSKKPIVPRRSWTKKEETALINALKEVVKDIRYKADNGFKAGYLNRLEELIELECPGTDLKGMPHITSKLTSWKKNYHSLVGMLNRSGVGFSPRGNFMIEVEDEQWEQIIKVDANARLMRYKPWPYYDDWLEIFGTDRATGEQAEDLHEAFLNLNKDDDVNIEAEVVGDKEFTQENNVTETSTDQVSQSCKDSGSAQKRRRTKKKARFHKDLQGVCEVLADMNDSTNARLDHLASRIGFEYDLEKTRAETWEQLGDIPGLSVADRFIVCELVAFKVERLHMWRVMSKESRIQYVEHLLSTRGA